MISAKHQKQLPSVIISEYRVVEAMTHATNTIHRMISPTSEVNGVAIRWQELSANT